MAKRFGRNQRRQMREQIDTLTTGLDETMKHLHQAMHQRDTLSDRLKTWARDVARLMGDDSAFNEQVRRMGMEIDTPVLELSPLTSVIDMAPFEGSAPCQMQATTIIRALIWRLNLSRDEFSHMVRIELHNRYGETTGYALHEEHVWSERDVDALARMIAQEMVRYKARHG